MLGGVTRRICGNTLAAPQASVLGVYGTVLPTNSVVVHRFAISYWSYHDISSTTSPESSRCGVRPVWQHACRVHTLPGLEKLVVSLVHIGLRSCQCLATTRKARIGFRSPVIGSRSPIHAAYACGAGATVCRQTSCVCKGSGGRSVTSRLRARMHCAREDVAEQRHKHAVRR